MNLRRRLPFTLATVLLLVTSAARLLAAPTGLQDIGTASFTDVGASVTSADYVITGSLADIRKDATGTYLAGAQTGTATITVSANNTTVGSFQLSAVTFQEFITSGVWNVYLTATKLMGGTIDLSASPVTGTTSADSYAAAWTSAFSGVDITSFTAHFTYNNSNNENLSLRSFTVASYLVPNRAPTISGAVAAQAVTDKTTISPFSGVTIGDVDSPAQTQTVSVTLDTAAKGSFTTLNGFTNAGGGVYTYSGTAAAATTAIRGLVFTPTANRIAPTTTETTTFTISTSDGIASAVTNNTTTVVSTSVNDAPTISGAVAAQAVNDNATRSPFTGVTIADVDSPAQTQSVSVTLDTAAKGSFTTLNGFTNAGGGVYTYSGTAAAATTAIRGLVFTPTANRVTPGTTETTTLTISVNDGVASAVTNNTTTVVSTSINNAPTITGAVAAQAVNDNATISPFSGVTIADVDSPAQTQSVSVTLDTAAKGSFSTLNGFTNAGSGVYTFSGTAAAATTAIRGLVFTPTANRVAVGSTETTTFTISTNDGVASAVTNNTTTVVSTSINNAPTITGAAAAQAVNDNATVAPFTGVTIADVDIPAQTQSVSVTLDVAAKGSFTTLNGFTNAGSGVYTFSGTAAAATTAIRGLVFTPTINRVTPASTETTTLTISVNDGVASAVTNNTTTVVSTSVNDAPTITGAVAAQAVNDNATISPFTGVTIADVDSPAQTQSVSVTLDTAAKGTFTTLNGFTDAGSGAYTFSGTAAAATTAIRGLVFTPTANRVAPGSTETTTFTISTNDGVASAVTNNTTTVVSTSVNDAPTITGATAGQTVNDNATISPFSGMTIADADSPAQTQSVSVTLDAAAKGTFTTLNGFTDAGSGVYTFNGTAAAATTAIRGLVFTSTANHVALNSTETTTFTISTSDGVASAVTNNTTTVVSTSVNDAPTISGTVASQAVNDNATASPFTGVTIADVDTPAQTQTVSVTLDTAAKGTFTTLNGFTNAGSGVYTYSGTAAAATTAIHGLVFTPTANRVTPGSTETTTFTISTNDGVASAVTNNTTTVVSTSVNDAPTIAGAVAAQAVNDNATVSPFTGVTIADVDTPAQTQSVSVTLDAAAKGTFTTLSGFTNAGSGVYTFSGTAAAATTAIRGLVFTPTANRVTPGSTETTTFTISTNDGVASAVPNNTTTVVSTSINDAPVAVDDTATTNQEAALDIAQATLLANDTDVDVGTTLTVTSVGNAQHGSVQLAGGVITFTPDAHFHGTASFGYTVSDGVGGSSTASVTVTVTPYTYATWKAQMFSVSDQADAAISGPAADPDHDGIKNLLEYAFDLVPTQADVSGLPTASLITDSGSNYLVVIYTRSLVATDLTYAVEVSTDLVTWSTLTPVEVSVTNHGDTETVVARDTVATTSTPRRFLRVTAAIP